MREIKSVILHCTATPVERELSVQEIRTWHVKGNGWDDIGYHYVIHQDGRIEKGRNIGKIGAHTWGNNYGSIGVAYCGGVEKVVKTKKSKVLPNKIGAHKTISKLVSKDTMTKAQEESFRSLFGFLEVTFGELKLRGHNDYNKDKDCPGFNIRDKYGDLVNR